MLEIFDLPAIAWWLATSWLGRLISLGFAVSVAGALWWGWAWDAAIAAAIVAWAAGTIGAAARQGSRSRS